MKCTCPTRRLLATPCVVLCLFAGNQLAAQELRLIRKIDSPHNLGVGSLQFSPDGKTLASAITSSNVKLWDVPGGKYLNVLVGHTSLVRGIAFSPDSKLLASVANDGTLKLWSLPDGKMTVTLKAHAAGVTGIAFSPDGKTIATSGFARPSTSSYGSGFSVKLWDTAKNKNTLTLGGSSTPTLLLAFDADGSNLITARNDRVELWNARTGKKTNAYSIPNGWYRAMAFGPQARVMVAGQNEETIALWDSHTGKSLGSLVGHQFGNVNPVAISGDGKLVASAGAHDHTIRLWIVKTGEYIATLKKPFHVVPLAFSPDGKLFASGGESQEGKSVIMLWEIVQNEGSPK